ncbi:MAG: GNAT family N-acetyltransferase [Candidatus Sumerlaeota bacterium]|nr:GNAT family N-acetyltransferase [Candidatus Sumerlaeota bacterium]
MPEILRTKIRPATIKDAETITDLWMDMMDEHQRFEPRLHLAKEARGGYMQFIQFHIANDDAIVLVAELDQDWDQERNCPCMRGAVIGFALAFKVQNLMMFAPLFYGFICDVVVQPEYRSRGWGEEMIRQIEEGFRVRGVSQVQLHVYRANDPARRFWLRMGYEPMVEGLGKELIP